MEISKKQARELALTCQLYNQQKLFGKEGVLDAIRQLSYLQIDTINIVERAHHHTLWSRISGYDRDWLDQLLSVDRSVYEYWLHAACYIPMEDYRFSLRRMERFPVAGSWESHYYEKHLSAMQTVLQRIKAEGPLGARDFEDTRAIKPKSGWGTGKPEKIALELLLWKGELMVDRRDKFNRVYDLRERILPSWVNQSKPSEDEQNRYYILRSLSALGLGTFRDIRDHFMLKQNPALNQSLQVLLETGEVLKLMVQNEKDQYYALPANLDLLSKPLKHPDQLNILSPFDNAIILRSRIKRLFGFAYTLECYVSPHKRVYGYWSLPLLYKGDFAGRIDCKARRSEGILEVLSLQWEEGIKPGKELMIALKAALQDFAVFNGCWQLKQPEMEKKLPDGS